jgi:uncharacterized caspase-like protein
MHIVGLGHIVTRSTHRLGDNAGIGMGGRELAAGIGAVTDNQRHGISIDGDNYLVPVDATVATKTAAMFELIDIDRILKGLDDEAHANIVILDACRDNPFESRISPSRSATKGGGLIAYQSVGSGTLIAFATAPGNTAADGTGAHSPFTTALLKHIGESGVEVNQMLTRVRIEVATEKKQIPWVNSSLLGEVYLCAESRPKASR